MGPWVRPYGAVGTGPWVRPYGAVYTPRTAPWGRGYTEDPGEPETGYFETGAIGR